MEGTYWPPISSDNDVEILKSVLIGMQYKSENIIVLENQEATKERIITRLNKLADLDIAKGDQLFVHFSCHGQQRVDSNGDEVDGLDECLVPYDSPMFYQENKYEGDKLISDDELQLLIKKLRRKLGQEGHIFVSVDACHSGTSLRGYGSQARGTDIIMGPPGKTHLGAKQDNQYLDANQFSVDRKQDGLAEICIFFGSSSNQLNYEYMDKYGVSYGSLSYFLAKNLSQNSNNCSYRSLFEKVSYEMSLFVPRQQAEAEGNLDITVLQGQSIESDVNYIITDIVTDSTVVINGGIFHGLLEGSTVSILETKNNNIKPKAEARVISSHANHSIILVKPNALVDNIANYIIVIKEKNVVPGQSTFTVIGKDEKLVHKIRNSLDSYPYLQYISKSPNLTYSIQNVDPQKSYCYILNNQLQKIDSVLILNENQANRAMERIIKITKNYLKAKYLKEIELSDPRMDVTCTIIPKPIKAAGPPQKIKTKSNHMDLMPTLKLGQTFQIKLHNFGTKSAYVSMINIQSDHKVNVLFPYGETSPLDFKIEPCQDLLIPVQYVAKIPKGVETLRLIASSKPIDFRSGFSTRSGSQTHPISILVDDILFDNTIDNRGAKSSIKAEDEININTIQFKIID